MSLSSFRKVCDFNLTFGLPHYNSINSSLYKSNPKLINLRLSLIREEIGELNDAFNNNDFIEVIDALADILYVVYGAGSSFGIDLDSELQKNNIIWDTNLTDYENYLSRFQPLEGITRENFNTYDQLKTNLATFDNYLNSLDNKLNLELELDICINELISMIALSYKMGIMMGINLDRAFNIVHTSNMSKVCPTEEQAQKTVKWYKENDTRYDSPDYRLSYDNQRYVVFNSSTGKILKNVSYKAADFTEMLG